MLKRLNKDNELELEHCLMDPSSFDLSRRKMPLYYKKLVVPMRMRSVYWKYFGFPANDDGTILTREKIVCIICKSQMIYNRNTSNLRMHLHSKHKNIFRKIEIEEGEKPPPTPSPGTSAKRAKTSSSLKNIYSRNVDGTVDFNASKQKNDNKEVHVVMTEEVTESDISNIAIIFPNNDELSEFNEVRHVTNDNTESSEITDAVVNFIITDLVPTDVVDGKGFNNLVSSLYNKPVTLPSEKKVTEELIPELYESCKQQVYNAIMNNCISNLSISIEEWQTLDGLKCESIYMHYLQNGEPRLFTKLLTTVYCTGSETAQHWISVLDKLFGDWNINSTAITGVILASECAELRAALQIKSITPLPCFLNILQRLCSENCFQFPDIKLLLEKCRRVVKFIQELKVAVYESATTNTDFEDDDYDENDENALNYDSPHSWLTTYYMLRGLLRRKETIIQVLNDSSVKLKYTSLSSIEWDKMQDLINVLKPLKTFVSTLFEEKNPSISLIKPITLRVNNAELEINEDDSSLTQQLKTTIKNFLNDAYGDTVVEQLISIATALDPRFKTYVQDEHFNLEQTLMDLLSELIRTEGACPSEEPSTSAGKSPSTDKKARLSGINALFGSFTVSKPAVTDQDRVKMEVQSYQTASNASFEECPLEWWQLMNKKCPNLIRLAHRYHCIPATVIFNGCHSVKEYMSYSSKRASLNVNMIDPLLFLHTNRVLF
ncbi:E3 SUMO-protein ligase ZBED1 [Planococcus citri]|uniref:E3 SUMO-protein ligase ZBED1 n=1 Tax=Planococcus citri TaxID=170843 RepID=UPI0031F81777